MGAIAEGCTGKPTETDFCFNGRRVVDEPIAYDTTMFEPRLHEKSIPLSERTPPPYQRKEETIFLSKETTVISALSAD
jgi:hypothetical protein